MLQDQPHCIGVRRSQFKGPLDSSSQFLQGRALQEPENLDVLPRSRTAQLRLEPTTQDAEADRQLPPRKRRGEVQRPGLALFDVALFRTISREPGIPWDNCYG